MPLFLKNRNEELTEKMDLAGCDQELLFNTYQQFSTVNRLISGWQQVYKKLIRPVFSNKNQGYSILDIGCGGGDIIKLLDKITKTDGFTVNFTGIDTDERAIQFLTQKTWPANIRFLQNDSSELAQRNDEFDLVISNHLVHHLTESELITLCEDTEKLTSRRIIFNDIERSDFGYASFKTLAPLIFHNSFIVEDGLTSIKRSYRKEELQNILPLGWQVKRLFPFRLLAFFDPPSI